MESLEINETLIYTSKYINRSISYVIVCVNCVFCYNIITVVIPEGIIQSNYIHIYIYIYIYYFTEQEIISSSNSSFLNCPVYFHT